MQPQFMIGHYRPIYLWAGDGTVRMNRLKFMDVPVNEAVHAEAHQEVGARRVLNDMRCNWVHLMYDWGFPPEIEAADWQAFEGAAQVYHQAGSPVFAYIQTSNCVYQGSFVDQDWYALDEHGRKVTYFTYSGRYMACLGNPAWKDHLLELALGALRRGADGIFFDNLFQGASPMALFGTWLGSAGCHCPHCQEAYQREIGSSILRRLRSGDRQTASYLRWRAEQVTGVISELAQEIRRLKPGTPISANDFDPILRNSYLVFGIDLQALAGVQDVTMIENYGLPRWDPAASSRSNSRARLANNALSVRTARSLVGDKAHLSVLSYDVGIGFDDVYPPRRYQQGIAEAAALGVSMTTKGTEYFDGQKMTLLTDAKYSAMHSALGQYHAWLEAHTDLYDSGRCNLAPVGLLFPGEALWLNWMRLSPLYFGVGQALTLEGFPWKVVLPGDDLSGLQVLLTFPSETGNQAVALNPASATGIADSTTVGGITAVLSGVDPGSLGSRLRVVPVDQVPGWEARPEPWIEKSTLSKNILGTAAKGLLGLYSGNKLARQFMDRLGMQKIVTESPLYFVPAIEARSALVQALGDSLYPRVRAQIPVLLEVWTFAGPHRSERPGRSDPASLHLVNYAAHPQPVQVDFGRSVRWQSISPDGEEGSGKGSMAEVMLDIYQILFIENDEGGPNA